MKKKTKGKKRDWDIWWLKRLVDIYDPEFQVGKKECRRTKEGSAVWLHRTYLGYSRYSNLLEGSIVTLYRFLLRWLNQLWLGEHIQSTLAQTLSNLDGPFLLSGWLVLLHFPRLL
jgi:hypothetical protein